MQWKNQLQAYDKATNKYVCVENAGRQFNLEGLQDMLRLHKAREIKSAVAQEMEWFSTGHLTPGNIKTTPPQASFSGFQSMLYNPRYDAIDPSTGMSSEELSKLCCRRWLSCDYMHWISNKLNSLQTDTLCIFLNQAGNVARFVTRRLPANTPRPRNLVFILNVGKRNGKVFIGDNVNPGIHWTFCHLDADKRSITYADSLAWNHPENLQNRIAEFYEAIYGETLVGTSFRSCHSHTSNGVCGPACATFYPLQRCADICGLVTVVCASIASLNRKFFDYITSNKKGSGPPVFLRTPSRYYKYLRLVVASWITEDTVTLDYIIPDTFKEQRDHD